MENLKLLSKIALSFKDLNNFDKDMKEVLEAVGKFVDVSRIYIIFIENEEMMTNTFEWCNKGATSQRENLKNIRCSDVPSWHGMFKDGILCSEDIRDLPADLIGALEPQEIKAIVVYPLTIKEEIIGYIGFDECRYLRKWKEKELQILNTVSGIISKAYERKRFQEELEDKCSKLTNIIEGSKLGTWEWNIQTGEVELNEIWADMLGYNLEELKFTGVNDYYSFIDKEDLKRSKVKLRDHLNGETEYYDSKVRIRDRDGNWIWIHDRGKIIEWDDYGSPIKMFGTHTDITKEKKREVELERFFSINLDLFCIVDMEARFLKVNKAWEDILGYTSKELLGRKISDFICAEDIPDTLEVFDNLKKGINIDRFVNRYKSASGKDYSIEWRANLHEDTVYASGRDVTARIKYEKMILELSNRDALTNIYNRRYAYKRAEALIQESKRTGREFSVCIIDIDNFKEINDKYGHRIGDSILKEFTELIKRNLRISDVFGRYGGEEFIIILKNTSIRESSLIINRILNIVREKDFICDGQVINFTFSAGICDSKEIENKDIIIDDLIEIADKRMYEAKNQGRDKIVCKSLKLQASI